MSLPVLPLVGTVCTLRPWTLDDLPDLYIRSCRTLEKAGFALEGRTRRSFLTDGVMYDQCCYGWVAE